MKKTKWLQRAYCALLGAVLAFTPTLFSCDNGSSGGGGGGESNVSDDKIPEIGIPEPNIGEGNYYPAKDDTGVYEDASLVIKFDATPTVCRDSGKTVKIYKGETLIDTIAPKDEIIKSFASKKVEDILVGKQLISIQGNAVVIKPHASSTAKASVLEYNTEYTVVVEEGLLQGKVAGADFKGVAAGAWKFTTRSAPTITDGSITVGQTGEADFLSLQGAFNYLMSNSKTGNWEINVGEGYYNDRLAYVGDANIKIVGANEGSIDDKVGQEGSSYKEKTVLHWKNMNGPDKSGYAWNPNTRKRAAFIWEGGDLELKNITIANRIDRAEVGTSGTQAEAFYFDSQNNMTAYNCSFKSH